MVQARPGCFPRHQRAARLLNGFHTEANAAIFTRNKDSKVRVQSLMPVPFATEQVPGQYGGLSWAVTDDPITGVHYTSSQPVLYAVTLVEIGDGASWKLTPTVKTDANGAVTAVGIKSGATQDEWTLPPN